MAKRTRDRRVSAKAAVAAGPRGWGLALFWVAVVVGLTLAASATINPLFGRSVHWDWVAGIAPFSFTVFAFAFRAVGHTQRRVAPPRSLRSPPNRTWYTIARELTVFAGNV